MCSRNRWRSRTTEDLFKHSNKNKVKSCGTAKSARVRISVDLILWADIIYVMEYHHKERIKELFPAACAEKEIIVLYIEDEYKYMNPELIEIFLTLFSKDFRQKIII